MPLLLWLLALLPGIFLILLALALAVRPIYERYSGSREVTCPESNRHVAVTLDAVRAAFTGLSGRPKLRLTGCTLWPERAACVQGCLPQAELPIREAGHESARPAVARKIRHLPIVAAAFAAWCLGVIWHSQYLFRAPWVQAVGLAGLPPRQISRFWAPHLLSIGICFLFAYGVAALLARRSAPGWASGIAVSLLFCCGIALASLAVTNIGDIAPAWLRIEAAYVFLASLLVGAIEGVFLKFPA